MYLAELAHPADLEGFRRAARAALVLAVPPDELEWQVSGAPAGVGPVSPLPAVAGAPPVRVPRRFLALAELAICHCAPERFRLLHALLIRLQGAPRLLEDRSDPQVDSLAELATAVSRDRQRMRALLRFRETRDAEGPHDIAWFEPDHHILHLEAGFFLRRFADRRWTILTPEASLHWDGDALHHLPGATRVEAPGEDPVETVWKTFQASIFGPAGPRARQADTPTKYWRTLPEGERIPALIASATERTPLMIAKGNEQIESSDGTAFDGEPQVSRRLNAAEAARRPGTPASPSLALLAQAASACTRCPLFGPATQTVFGEGPADAQLMIVGEQPGDQEDLQGRPFVGPAGQLLDRALAEAGIDRGRAYVTNAVKHFKFEPRGRRRIHQSPVAAEIEACRWWLDQERALLKPALVLMLGASAGRALLGRAVAVGRERGKLLSLPDGRPAFLTVHPSYLLRIENPAAQRAEQARFVEELKMAATAAGVT